MSGRNPNYDRLTITSKGFQFLLEDRQTQLWQILMFYLNLREVSGSEIRPHCWCFGVGVGFPCPCPCSVSVLDLRSLRGLLVWAHTRGASRIDAYGSGERRAFGRDPLAVLLPRVYAARPGESHRSLPLSPPFSCTIPGHLAPSAQMLTFEIGH
jgi:hypothetical protein